jgi:MFS family permease
MAERLMDADMRARPARLPLYALLAANAVSLTGNALSQVAIPWYVLQTTGSAAQTGVTAFFGTLPLILGAFFGGALVDRIGHQRSSVISDLLSGVSVLLIPILAATTGLQFWQLLALVFLGALFDAPGVAARQALLPDLARRGGMTLERANVIFSTVQRASTMVGPLLAGGLIAALGAGKVLIIDAATFAVSAALVGLLIPAARVAAPASRRYWADVTDGWRFLMSQRLLRTVIIAATISNFLLSPVFSVILPVYVNELYGDAARLGVLLAVFGAGAVGGAMLYGLWSDRLARRTIFVGGFAIDGLIIPLIALAPPFWVLLGLMALNGLAIGPLNPMVHTLVQERTPAEMRARVFGVLMALAYVAMPAGMLAAGYLAESFGVRAALLVFGAGSLALALWLLLDRSIRRIDAA